MTKYPQMDDPEARRKRVKDQHFFSVSEIFSSVQGEGPMTGTPATFIRFAGCNMECPWCDTDHRRRVPMTDESILDSVMAHNDRWVILTGGEPTIQPHLDGLIQLLSDYTFGVALETNGSTDTTHIMRTLNWLTVSPKTVPNTHQLLLHGCYNQGQLRTMDELRILIHSNEQSVDIPEWLTPQYITFSPVMTRLESHKDRLTTVDMWTNRSTLQRCIELAGMYASRGGRLSVQLHKLIGIQ